MNGVQIDELYEYCLPRIPSYEYIYINYRLANLDPKVLQTLEDRSMREDANRAVMAAVVAMTTTPELW